MKLLLRTLGHTICMTKGIGAGSSRVIIYSHGFGVRKDDRGTFTDIAAAMPEARSVMFEYNEIDEVNGTLTVRPFSEQTAMLREVYTRERTAAPDAAIDIVAHSQGCVIAALAVLPNVRKAILLTPPTAGGEDILRRYKDNPKAHIDLAGMSTLKRSDGSTTLVPAQYFAERLEGRPPLDLYNELAEHTELTLVIANQDHVLGVTKWDTLSSKAHLIHLDGDHEFSGAARMAMVSTVQQILCENS